MLNLLKLSPLAYLLLASLALNLTLGIATYKLYGSKKVAESAAILCQEANEGFVLELSRQEAVCTIQDQLIAENNIRQEDIRSEQDVLLDAIDSIPPKVVRNRDILVDQLELVVKKKVEQEGLDTNENYANLDALLPTDFSSLLESAHRQATD